MSKPRTVSSILAAIVVVAVAAGAALAGSSHSSRSAATTFTVTVENLSKANTLKTSAGAVPVPISPGAWAVYRGSNPLFTRGARADRGTERIAEDGDTSVKARALEGIARVTSSGVFTQNGGALGGAFEPGSRTQFTLQAAPGDWFQFEAMFVQSNDYFYALGGDGVALFDPKGKPVSGDLSRYVNIWDAGTEVDEEPGNGTFAKPNQDPAALDVGPGTREPVDVQSQTGDPWQLPAVSKLIKVTITPQG